MNRTLRLAAATAALVAFALAADAAAGPRGGWELLGERTVTDAVDHDTIAVTAAKGTFRKLRLRVFERAVQFRRVTVHFATGPAQEIELREVIRAGGQSRVVDLAGGDRVIQRIELVYDAQSLGGRAVVRVFGLN